MAIVSNTLSNGTVISAADLNENFSDLTSYVQALDDSDISPDAGITSRKLLDRYAVSHGTVLLLPFSAAAASADLNSPEMFSLPSTTTSGTATTVCRLYPEFKPGRRMYLAAVSFFAIGGTFTDPPAIWVFHNTTLLSGSSGVVMTNTGPWYLKNSDPFGSPLTILDGAATPGDYIEFRIGRSVNSGTVANSQLRGLYATLTFKHELSS